MAQPAVITSASPAFSSKSKTSKPAREPTHFFFCHILAPSSLSPQSSPTTAVKEEDMADEQPPVPANAEDRKAASALANLDSNDDAAASSSAPVDLAAINKATKGAAAAAKDAYKNVKVEAADVALLVDELELPKPKATELLKRHEGDAVKAMRAYVAAA
ncbi:hypothetical protein NLG97_g9780 [Lecanicillium saksenae]|uniref:Uncharacterized protein n=1 Tax=Lecanicillium saksenae TaxID=468837 RepID=A0ACC1QIB0_9HYPO|nr:hypothetical protein NLG97_g9780 [Lecanicillium saksenae]